MTEEYKEKLRKRIAGLEQELWNEAEEDNPDWKECVQRTEKFIIEGYGKT